MDLALSPAEDDLETDKLELFHATEAAQRAVEQARVKATAMRRAQDRRGVEA